MAVVKCKMCGGDLNLIEGASTAECEFCGSVQTIPNLDDEKKLIQFERAERLRKQCEFDKAAGIYETIVADFRQEAEAYWGLVLCKFGIEYVDDPATGKKIPTCHRSSFDSIMEDSDFEQALENADVMARRVYRDEAKQIEEIRKGIIAVSNNEKPYDIFICYKETAENGDRTLDSVLAQDVYDALTDKGYRVFFSRITLEEKLGMEYEPYIFAALNSAKIMLAFGTDYEYFNAVWVKNEWSRFLKLMAKDKDKHLIPCYKGIDAYDMPKEFARLQAQDLGKVGAIQDLLRGIEKILPRQTAQPTIVQERVVVGGSGSNKIASLLDRGNMALEDGDWAKADSFFEDVLNNDSKNAQAYLGKTLAMEKCRTIDAFARKRKDASQNVRGETLELQPDRAHVDEMAKRFSLPEYVEESEIRKLYDYDLCYHSDVAERMQQYRNEENYWVNHKWLSKAEKFAVGAVAENLQREKKALFAALSDRVKKAEAAEAAAKQAVQNRYEAHLKQADEKAEKLYHDGISRREMYYRELLQTAKTSSDVYELTETAKQFEQLGDFQDSRNLAEHCHKRAAEEQAKLDAEAERRATIARIKADKQQKRNRIISVIILSAISATVIIWSLFVKVIIPGGKYRDAVALMDAGQYADAALVFALLDNYKDSQMKIAECSTAILDGKYNNALALMDAEKYDEAIDIWLSIENYNDSAEKILRCEYLKAVALLNKGEYEQAIAAFTALGEYDNSAQMIKECKYAEAKAFLDAGMTARAAIAFGAIADYKDAKSQSLALWDKIAVRHPISTESFTTLGLTTDGNVVVAGSSSKASNLTDVVAISSSLFNTVALKSNGTVVSVAWNNYGEANVSGWKDIVAITTSDWLTIGLKLDGTLVTAGGLHDYGQWNVSQLENIIAISADEYHTVVLHSDNTVTAIGNNEHGECNVSSWKDIIAIGTGSCHTVGLRADGTVVAVGNNDYGQCDVSDWSNIVAISVGDFQTIGLKADGSVVAVGNNRDGECNVSGWKEIVAIFSGDDHTIGLKADGTVVAVGDNGQGQCNVGKWKNIKVPEGK